MRSIWNWLKLTNQVNKIIATSKHKILIYESSEKLIVVILILRLSICDVTFKSFIDHVVSTLHVPGRREHVVLVFYITYVLHILNFRSRNERPQSGDRGDTKEEYIPEAGGLIEVCHMLLHTNWHFSFMIFHWIILKIFHLSEQLGWGCGQLWWHEPQRRAIERNLCLWIWETLCYSTESHYSLY